MKRSTLLLTLAGGAVVLAMIAYFLPSPASAPNSAATSPMPASTAEPRTHTQDAATTADRLETGSPLPESGPKPPMAASESRSVLPAGMSDVAAAKLQELDLLSDPDANALLKALEPLREWARRDPAAAAAWVLANLHAGARGHALEEVFGLWGQSAPADAIEYLRTAGSVEGLHGAYAAAFSGFAHTDPEAAAAWLLDAGNRTPPDGWSMLIAAWGQSDPEAAARWAAANLPADRRDSLLPELLAHLRTPAATGIILAQVDPAAANQALVAAARLASHIEPAFAMDLASRISDPSLRGSAQAETLGVWARANPAEAAATAAQLGIAPPPRGMPPPVSLVPANPEVPEAAAPPSAGTGAVQAGKAP